MNIFEEHISLLGEKETLNIKYEELTSEIIKKRSNMLNVTDEELEERNKVFEELQNIKKKIIVTRYLISGLSIFNLSEFAKPFEEVLSCSEGAKFCFHSCKRVEDGIQREMYLVVEESLKQDKYSLDELAFLKQSKKALIFNGDFIRRIAIFYKEDNGLKLNCNLDDFPFAKEFVDELICYKNEEINGQSTFGVDILEKLKDQFILRNVDRFIEHHETKDRLNKEQMSRLKKENRVRKVYQKLLLEVKNGSN